MLVLLIVCGTTLAVAIIGPSLGEEQKKGRKVAARKAAPFVHSVIFYLKKDAPDNEAESLIADAHQMLAKIPGVRDVHAGRPAEKATPGVAVKDYQVGLLVLFDDADGLHAYLEHPTHKDYVAKHEKHLDKVLVYDFEDKR
jgi:hypothetical protein